MSDPRSLAISELLVEEPAILSSGHGIAQK
jgi:hypothetical protein